MLKIAIKAALAAGAIQKKYYRGIRKVMIKGYRTNLVTRVDFACEKKIKGMIKSAYPGHGFLAEESGGEGGGRYLWVIDPLDGTVNYAHGFPLFCSSVAVQKDGETVAGAVYAPLTGELFTAEKGKGARLNGRRIKVSKKNKLEVSFLATGFPYTVHQQPGKQFKHFEKLCRTAQAVRRAGSAALDLCYVACGVFDGFWEKNLMPWDTAAACLILSEAGGKVSDYKGGSFSIFNKDVVATNGKVHRELVRLLGKTR